LELNFSVEADEVSLSHESLEYLFNPILAQFGVNKIVPLKEGGESLHVTQENKREFVQLSAQYRLYSSIEKQIENLLSGFYEIIPKELVTIVSSSLYIPFLMLITTSSTNKSSNF